MPDGQLAVTLPDWAHPNILADGKSNPNITRAMGIGPVNAPQATSVMGQGPNIDDEVVIRRLEVNRQVDRKVKTSDDHQVNDHRGR